MTDFKNQYHKDSILDFIDNPVITNTNTMKRVIPFSKVNSSGGGGNYSDTGGLGLPKKRRLFVSR
jgi:hypothetical protein